MDPHNMIIIKNVPGMTRSDLLQALLSLRAAHGPGAPEVSTGHTGYVVDEATAYDFLRTYLQTTAPRRVAHPHVSVEIAEQARPVTDRPAVVVYEPIPAPAVPEPARVKEPDPVVDRQVPSTSEPAVEVDQQPPVPAPTAGGTRRTGRRSRRDV